MKPNLSIKMIRHLAEHPSPLFQRLELTVLMKAASEAFGMKAEEILLAKDPLKVFAEYTQMAAGRADIETQRLYETMRQTGIRLRKITGLKKAADRYELLFMLYRHIGIELSGSIDEGFHFAKCYFSRYYTPQVCRLVSAMDAGIIAGLFEDGELIFTRRITEGCTACEACFRRRNHE